MNQHFLNANNLIKIEGRSSYMIIVRILYCLQLTENHVVNGSLLMLLLCCVYVTAASNHSPTSW